jgi:diaminopimelate decarboxylase
MADPLDRSAAAARLAATWPARGSGFDPPSTRGWRRTASSVSGSPLYIYDAQAVRAAFCAFRGAFRYEPTEFHYAIVCNKNPYLIRVLNALGAGIHANTPGDAHAALSLGIPAGQIVYSGTNWTRRPCGGSPLSGVASK